jgi:hypothetical protein
VNPKINVIHYISKILYHDEHFSALHVGGRGGEVTIEGV